MIYPDNFEIKIGFSEIRSMLNERCLSPLGLSHVEVMTFSDDVETVNEWHQQTDELRLLLEENPDFPLDNIFDVRESVSRARIVNTHLEEEDFFHLRRSLDTIHKIVTILHPDDDQMVGKALFLLSDGIATFPNLVQRIDQVIDKFGHMRDTASPELQRLRRELSRAEGSVSRTIYGILRAAQADGLIDKDVTPAVRDGRLVIPVAPGLKRRINGIVHDESATGRTVFVEPTEVVEANNHIRKLEAEERQEVIRILTALTQHIRPNVREILDSFHFLGIIDFLQAKVQFGKQIRGLSPQLSTSPYMDWIEARNPLLEKQLEVRGAKIVPLNITLTPEKHILIISGPNAGGKSVCLKTVGLLQYMLQCGVPIPVSERSSCGIFEDLMIDIGDEQSIENDLSTYSSHLLNMKNMMKQATSRTLILIDEFGTGTEPQIGGAIAESVLDKFCRKGAWGVITTHYQNLKHFADTHPGVVNGAMLYDRHEMRALFQLAIGRPGSSFAIEIARKIGLPEDVIAEASEIVGSDYIQSDKYLQDIVRDKRYWEGKRQTIHQREKEMEKTIERYEQEIKELQQQRKTIVTKAKADAEELLRESNRRIENAIREIREQQAEKEVTKKIREELHQFEQAVKEGQPVKGKQGHGLMSDDEFEKKVEQLRQRKLRKEKRKQEKSEQAVSASKKEEFTTNFAVDKAKAVLAVGDTVRIRGLKSTGTIESIDGQMCTVVFGDMRSKIRVNRLEAATSSTESTSQSVETAYQVSRTTRDTIDDHRKNFKQDLDVRGMRGDEALNAVQYFIDDAILMGMSRVRILHGKGNGILRNLIRQYLSTVSNVVHYADEHVQFGGAGITVVDL
ncbi:Smr/MutS family protein [Prevotella salivae]|uniref:Endonuclease MutS2 n=1 Tax=Segatella salivae TaxID=228604 RepID=A0AAW4NQG1_9BACT|nr:Smr/MutS family protein [Segatella salivae]MBW4866212.1 Smr/MutS family protein [Segatella salivae]MBW4909324.1 Smr/MutS family protein [Segatella salivae]